jgi:Ca-activated chloride channel family protein
MNLADLHFAQPLWLWGLFLLPLGLGWYAYCRRYIKRQRNTGLEKFADKALLGHILQHAYRSKRNWLFGWLFAFIITLLIVALANPRWKYEEIEAFTPTASMVVLLDLGEQMSAQDIVPSRVVKARQYIEDLINASRGLKIGLIGFAANPHLISPITDDLKTLKNYLPALDTFLVNKQGDNLHLALKAAQELLQAEPGTKKSILLLSDGNFVDNNFTDLISDLASKEISLHVIGIGTIAGAPFTDQNGRMSRDAHNNLSISKLNQAVLKVIAKKGNGVYVDGNQAALAINTILDKAQYIESNEPLISGKVRQWEDGYVWFLIPAVMLFGVLLTQRALYLMPIILCFAISHSNDVYAFEVKNLFKNADQVAVQQFDQTNFAAAAEQFSDPYRKGVAYYRAGDYAAAELHFTESKRSSVQLDALYNAGNAQMQQKKWRAAVASYEKVLEIQADHADAKHNLELAKKMLTDDNCECDNPDKDQKGDKGNQGKNSDNKSDQQDNSQQQDKSDNSDQSNQNDSNTNQSKQDQHDQKNQDQQQPDNKNASNSQDQSTKLDQQKAEQNEARATQWLNRLNSDIRVFLQNKFYLEDVVLSKR